MQFLRTLFWVVVAVAGVVFAFRNWTPVTVNLWGGLQADAKLPVLLFGAFLLGLLPPYVLHRATRWRMKRKLDLAERQIAELRSAEAPFPPMESTAPAPTITVAP